MVDEIDIEGLSDRRCLVLGARGFIGSSLTRLLAGRVKHLRCFSRPPAPHTHDEGVEWMTGDFQNKSDLARALADVDVVFHLINGTTPASANADMVNDVGQNIVGTLGLLDVCREAGVKRIIFASSGGTVYGVPQQIPTPEQEPCWPVTAYGISKLAIERYLHLFEYHHDIEYRVLRLSNPYGPGQTATKNQGVIGAFLLRVLAGEPVQIWGDGAVARDYFYVDDAADAFARAALHQGKGRVFNIGSGISRPLTEIVDAIRAVTGMEILIDRKPGRLVDIPVSCLSIHLAEQELGWRPSTDFHDGLSKTVEWMRREAAV